MLNAAIAERPYPTCGSIGNVQMGGNIATTAGECGTAGGTSGAYSWWALLASNEGAVMCIHLCTTHGNEKA